MLLRWLFHQYKLVFRLSFSPSLCRSFFNTMPNERASFSCLLMFLASSFQALDTFDAAIVSPVYYVMFTTLTIIASAIMFKVDISNISWNMLLMLHDAFIICIHYWEMVRCNLFLLVYCAGLVRSDCQQHCLWDMWIHHRAFRNNHTSCDQRTGATSCSR